MLPLLAFGFTLELLDLLAEQTGEYSRSPEDILIELEDKLDSGELSVDQVILMLEDQRSNTK